jgi:hypothetical protein
MSIKITCENCGKIIDSTSGLFPIKITVEAIYQSDRRGVYNTFDYCSDKCALKCKELKDYINTLGKY